MPPHLYVYVTAIVKEEALNLEGAWKVDMEEVGVR